MIAPLALTLALAFWAPYTPDLAQPCLPSIHYYAPSAQLPADAVAAGVTSENAAGFATVGSGCNGIIWLGSGIGGQPIADQCLTLVHEIGHAIFGLGHSNDSRDVMSPGAKPPAACVPPVPRRYRGDPRCRVRWWENDSPVWPSKCPARGQLWDQDGPVARR